MSNVVDVPRVLPWIRDRHCVAVLIEVHVGPGFLGGVVLVLVVGGNFGRAWIRGDVAAVYSLLAGVVALVESRLEIKETTKDRCPRVYPSDLSEFNSDREDSIRTKVPPRRSNREAPIQRDQAKQRLSIILADLSMITSEDALVSFLPISTE